MADSRKTGETSTADDLERLQDLILGAEKNRLHKLDHRVTDLEMRTADVAEVLPGAMSRLVDDPVSKSEIEEPIVHTIRGAIKRDTHSFAEALFPVLGPAIRRAVADALKSLVQRINVALENSFTIKGLRWRLEAARTGVPFAQIVLRHTMVYAIQEAFLIQRNSGLVLASVRRDEALALDEDAVSSMLTAIQSFIQDSFGVSADEPLRSAELGDRTLWVINGPDALLACVISGTPPRPVRDELMDLLETLHARFGDRFREHPEVLAGHAGLSALMQESLREEVDSAVRGAARIGNRLAWGVAGLAVLVIVAWSIWENAQRNRLEEDAVARFSAEPGYHLTGHEFRSGRLVLSGLRDPLAAAPETVLAAAALPADEMAFEFQAFQSLEPVMVERHLRRALGLGAEVELRLSGAELVVTGALGSDQYRGLEELPGRHAVIGSVNLEGARLAADEAIMLIGRELDLPATASVVAAGERMAISGTAGAAWFVGAREGQGVIGGWPLDFGAMEATLTGQFESLAEQIHGWTVLFDRRTRLSDGMQDRLDSAAVGLQALQELGGALGRPVPIRLFGYADGTGTAEQNATMSLERARTVREALQQRGVDTAGVELVQGSWSSGTADRDQRKVVLMVGGESRP